MFLAVFLTVTIELYAGRKLRTQVAEDVLSGVFNKIIPPVIFDEVKSQIIQSPVIKRKWELRMVLRDDEKISGTDPNYYISRTVLSYSLENLLNRPQIFTISSGLSRDHSAVDSFGNKLPRFVTLKIDNQEVTGAELENCFSENKSRLSKKINLPAGGGKLTEVLIEIEELVRVPESFYWATPNSADGVTIDIDSSSVPGLTFNAIPYHPNAEAFNETIKGKRWVFSGGILPFQGFEIEARKTDNISDTLPSESKEA